MKTYLDKNEVKIVKELGIIDKEGTWVQIEYLDGVLKGMKKPTVKENLNSKK